MYKRTAIYVIAALIFATLARVMTSLADDPAPKQWQQWRSVHLLDRGAAESADAEGGSRTHTTPSLMSAILYNMMGTGTPTPGMPATMPGALLTAPGAFVGYFFAPGVDFPTSYHPFFVTGAYASLANGGTAPVVPILGAGVAAGPFPAGPTMWAGFTAVPAATPVPTPFIPVAVGAAFGHSPAVSVPPGFGVACGADPVGAPALVLAGLGGTGGGKPLVSFMAAPDSLVSPFAAAPLSYVVGCFISGATVPVELQSFHIE